jgi:type II secretory pathway component PulF
MERFFYEAIDGQGRRVIDSDTARDRETLLLSLQTQGLVLVRWLEGGRPARFRIRRRGRSLRSGELLQLTKELSHLLKSGLPLDRALSIIGESATSNNVISMVAHLKESIRGGSSLSDAMALKSADFSDLYVNMVRVGEVGGVLPQALEKVTQFMERSEEIKRFIISSSIYPVVLMCVGLVSIIVIMGFVVPRFAGIFKDLGQEIPLPTQILMTTSEFLSDWWIVLIVCVALAVFMLWRWVRSPSNRGRVDRLVIGTPLLGPLMLDTQVSRFARTLGTLLESGVPVLKALSIVQKVVGNTLVQTAVAHIYEQVREGKRISTAMHEREVFPPLAVQMVSVGEETGRLGDMLVVVSDELDAKIQAKIRAYLALLEPLAILTMGLIIGAIVVSMLSAILGINEIEF